MPVQPLSLKGRALRLLGGREHSRAELERKLAQHEQEPGQLQRALDELQAKGFISDARVVESVLHRRAPKLGADRIRHELRGKGVDGELVSNAMQELRPTELDRARQVRERKFADLPADASEHAKQARFLAGRGFSADVIRRVLGGGPDDE
jgi:regulatory protein